MHLPLLVTIVCKNKVNVNGKAHPTTVHDGIAGEYRYSSTFI